MMMNNFPMDLWSIGIRVSGCHEDQPKTNTDIEQVLLSALEAFPSDARLVSVLHSWLKVHGNYVIVEKLGKFAKKRWADTPQHLPWLTMAAAWAHSCGYAKWKKLAQPVAGPVYLYPEKMTRSAVQMHGADACYEPLGIIIPNGSIRIRERDVLTPEQLAKANLQYKNRYLFGPSWRADIITAIQQGISSPMEICRAVGCSYEPAYRVSHEYHLAVG